MTYYQLRGKHKIYVGMSPGVGKTFRMLEEAHQLKQEGIDVVIGLLETHGRKETAEMAEGLEIIPKLIMKRGDVELTEMDTDGIIARRPQLVLIDELAHTNVPSSIRSKRYQDVEEILKAGINVNSTMNIQHIESLNDVVAKITGVVVRERVPDRIIEEADELLVVDITPATLQQRLVDGKIYAPDKIQPSLDNFFKRSNLIALRELALREVANTVEEDIIDQSDGSRSTIHERFLICVSTYPNSIQLIRRGARLANYMNGDLYAVFVDNPDRFITKEEAIHLDNCERLCKEFGGHFLRVTDSNASQGIAKVAKEYKITQIVLGETKQSAWHIFWHGSFINKLMGLIENMDIHVISSKSQDKSK